MSSLCPDLPSGHAHTTAGFCILYDAKLESIAENTREPNNDLTDRSTSVPRSNTYDQWRRTPGDGSDD